MLGWATELKNMFPVAEQQRQTLRELWRKYLSATLIFSSSESSQRLKITKQTSRTVLLRERRGHKREAVETNGTVESRQITVTLLLLRVVVQNAGRVGGDAPLTRCRVFFLPAVWTAPHCSSHFFLVSHLLIEHHAEVAPSICRHHIFLQRRGQSAAPAAWMDFYHRLSSLKFFIPS